MSSQKHVFAFFAPQVKELQATLKHSTTITLHDAELIKRLGHVVRLTVGDTCILFNEHIHARITIVAIHKKEITVRIDSVEKNKTYSPAITCLLPVLKKDDLAFALTNLAACGVNTIQLVTTDKTQRHWSGTKELERLERVIVAAAEQSKHFALPHLHAPIPLAEALKTTNESVNIFFDPTGQPLLETITSLHKNRNSYSTVSLLIGPEGDLTQEEKELVEQHKFIFCALTPTILRAHVAITLGAGIARSVL